MTAQKQMKNRQSLILHYIKGEAYHHSFGQDTYVGMGKGRRRGYLGVVQLSESGARVRQQEIAAQDGHFVAKLHVLERAVRHRPLLQVDDPAVHQEGRVDQLRDFRQVPLTKRRTGNKKGRKDAKQSAKSRMNVCSFCS